MWIIQIKRRAHSLQLLLKQGRGVVVGVGVGIGVRLGYREREGLRDRRVK